MLLYSDKEDDSYIFPLKQYCQQFKTAVDNNKSIKYTTKLLTVNTLLL